MSLKTSGSPSNVKERYSFRIFFPGTERLYSPQECGNGFAMHNISRMHQMRNSIGGVIVPAIAVMVYRSRRFYQAVHCFYTKVFFAISMMAMVVQR